MSHIVDTQPELQQKPTIIRQRKIVKQEEMPVTNVQVGEEEDDEVTDRQEGMKLLLQIQKDKNELMDSFKELMGSNMNRTAPPSAPKEKNHVDLFFESVSSSVKALSPKMIAEAKMRVSQLICELELRALTENDQHQTVLLTNDTSGAGSYIINHASTIHQNHSSDVHHVDGSVTGVHHYEPLS